MIVLSIDPGLVNVGCAILDVAENKILFADKIHFALSMKEHRKTGDAAIVSRVHSALFGHNSKIKKLIKKVDVVLIEIQMKPLYKIIQHVIGALFYDKNVETIHVAPTRIKRHFKTSCKSHKENKKAAIKKATELFPKLMSSLNAKKKDDVSDALLQGVWYKNTLFKNN